MATVTVSKSLSSESSAITDLECGTVVDLKAAGFLSEGFGIVAYGSLLVSLTYPKNTWTGVSVPRHSVMGVAKTVHITC